MCAVSCVHTTRNTDAPATSVTEQFQTPVNVFLTVIQWEVHQQFFYDMLTTSLKHLVVHQRSYLTMSFTARLTEVLVAVEAVPLYNVI